MKTGEDHGLYDYSPIIDRWPLRWPDGARVAVWVIPNIEHYELEAEHGKIDVRNYSRTDYGNRVGLWRLMELMDRHGIRGTVALNAAVCRHYPRIIEEVLKRDWELMGHGLTNSELLPAAPPGEEREVILRTVTMIREATGRPVRGWLGPALAETPGTLDLLQEAGIEYVCDWVNDDQPYRMRNGLYSIPYSIEINDMPLFREPSITPADYAQMVSDAFDVLHREGEHQGRVLGLPLHPFLIGTPHRIGALDRALSYIQHHAKVWFATGAEIIAWYRNAESAHRAGGGT